MSKISTLVKFRGLEPRLSISEARRKIVEEGQSSGSFIFQAIESNRNNWLLAIVLQSDDVYEKRVSACRVNCGKGKGILVVFGRDTKIPEDSASVPCMSVFAGITKGGHEGTIDHDECLFDHISCLTASSFSSLEECWVELQVEENSSFPDKRWVPRQTVRFVASGESWGDCEIEMIPVEPEEESSSLDEREDGTNSTLLATKRTSPPTSTTTAVTATAATRPMEKQSQPARPPHETTMMTTNSAKAHSSDDGTTESPVQPAKAAAPGNNHVTLRPSLLHTGDTTAAAANQQGTQRPTASNLGKQKKRPKAAKKLPLAAKTPRSEIMSETVAKNDDITEAPATLLTVGEASGPNITENTSAEVQATRNGANGIEEDNAATDEGERTTKNTLPADDGSSALKRKPKACFYAPLCLKSPIECGGYRQGTCSQVNDGIISFTDEELNEAKRKRRLELRRERKREENNGKNSAPVSTPPTLYPKQQGTRTIDSDEDHVENLAKKQSNAPSTSKDGPQLPIQPAKTAASRTNQKMLRKSSPSNLKARDDVSGVTTASADTTSQVTQHLITTDTTNLEQPTDCLEAGQISSAPKTTQSNIRDVSKVSKNDSPKDPVAMPPASGPNEMENTAAKVRTRKDGAKQFEETDAAADEDERTTTDNSTADDGNSAQKRRSRACFYAPLCLKSPTECGGYHKGGCSQVNGGIISFTDEELYEAKRKRRLELKRSENQRARERKRENYVKQVIASSNETTTNEANDANESGQPRENSLSAEDSDSVQNRNATRACFYAPLCLKSPSECGGFVEGKCSQVINGIIKFTEGELLAAKHQRRLALQRSYGKKSREKRKRVTAATKNRETHLVTTSATEASDQPATTDRATRATPRKTTDTPQKLPEVVETTLLDASHIYKPTATARTPIEDNATAEDNDFAEARHSKSRACFYAPLCSKLASECGGYRKGMCSQVNNGTISFTDEELESAKHKRHLERKRLNKKRLRERKKEKNKETNEGLASQSDALPTPKRARTGSDSAMELQQARNNRNSLQGAQDEFSPELASEHTAVNEVDDTGKDSASLKPPPPFSKQTGTHSGDEGPLAKKNSLPSAARANNQKAVNETTVELKLPAVEASIANTTETGTVETVTATNEAINGNESNPVNAHRGRPLENSSSAEDRDSAPSLKTTRACYYAPLCSKLASECGGFFKGKCSQVNNGSISFTFEELFTAKEERRLALKRASSKRLYQEKRERREVHETATNATDAAEAAEPPGAIKTPQELSVLTAQLETSSVAKSAAVVNECLTSQRRSPPPSKRPRTGSDDPKDLQQVANDGKSSLSAQEESASKYTAMNQAIDKEAGRIESVEGEAPRSETPSTKVSRSAVVQEQHDQVGTPLATETLSPSSESLKKSKKKKDKKKKKKKKRNKDSEDE